jgi:hypothetical protein
MNAVSIISMALNLAVNCCFGLSSVPGLQRQQGKFMAATVVFSLVDFFVEVFLGGQGVAQPDMVGVTSNELKGDLDLLRAQIASDLFEELKTDKLAKMQTIEGNWQEAWGAACQAQASGTGDPIVDARLDRDWKSYYTSFKTECDNPSTVELCNWLALHDAYKFETLALYTMAAGLYLNICQLCLLIEFNDIMNDASLTGNAYQTARDHWLKVDLPAWKADHAAWEAEQAAALANAFQIANPGFGRGHWTGIVSNDPGNITIRPEPVRPSPPYVPPTCFDQLITSPYANHIRAKVKLFIAYADPVVTAFETKAAKRAADLLARTSGFAVVPGASANRYKVTDSFSGFASPETGQQEADLWKQIEIGIVLAGLRASGDPALAYASDDDVKKYRSVIDNWRECEKNYAILGGS